MFRFLDETDPRFMHGYVSVEFDEVIRGAELDALFLRNQKGFRRIGVFFNEITGLMPVDVANHPDESQTEPYEGNEPTHTVAIWKIPPITAQTDIGAEIVFDTLSSQARDRMTERVTNHLERHVFPDLVEV